MWAMHKLQIIDSVFEESVWIQIKNISVIREISLLNISELIGLCEEYLLSTYLRCEFNIFILEKKKIIFNKKNYDYTRSVVIRVNLSSLLSLWNANDQGKIIFGQCFCFLYLWHRVQYSDVIHNTLSVFKSTFKNQLTVKVLFFGNKIYKNCIVNIRQ